MKKKRGWKRGGRAPLYRSSGRASKRVMFDWFDWFDSCLPGLPAGCLTGLTHVLLAVCTGHVLIGRMVHGSSFVAGLCIP